MIIVVAYDIRDDRRRRKVSQALRNVGDRVQRSVVECELSDGQFRRLRTS